MTSPAKGCGGSAEPEQSYIAVRDHGVMNAAPDPRGAADDVSSLVGMRLCSVVFVMDYLQLMFDGSPGSASTLTCYVWPTVETPRGVARQGDVGYADTLASLIPNAVVATAATPIAGIRIEWQSGALVLNPTPDELAGPEIATLRDLGSNWRVWRPGEDVFSHLA